MAVRPTRQRRGSRDVGSTTSIVSIEVLNGDILAHSADLMVLKHADGFHGVDGVVAGRIGFTHELDTGGYAFRPGVRVEATTVLFLGVGPLVDFRYAGIRAFAERALELAAGHDSSIETICSPIHGPGYGLDDSEAFLSLIGGFYDALDAGSHPPHLRQISIVEKSTQRADRLRAVLEELTQHSGSPRGVIIAPPHVVRHSPRMESVGEKSEQKKKLVVAMPFADAYEDIWEIAIQEACSHAGILCEHIGLQSYTGDVMLEIKKRVQSSCGLIGVLNDANPNVFLEIGYAWGLGKPTILIANDVTNLPYDVKGQKCLEYKSISQLRTRLKDELLKLKEDGVFG